MDNSGPMASSNPPPSPGGPLSINIPRQRSFSSSFSLATSPSPRTFTGSSIVSNPNNAFGGPSSFSAALAPLSPTTTTPTGTAASVNGSQTIPVLHRRFSSSFNQLNQIASASSSSPTASGSQANERGRRASFFGGTGTSPALMSENSGNGVNHSNNSNNSKTPAAGGGLFRAFSVSGKSSGHPLDRNDAGPINLGANHISGNNNYPHDETFSGFAPRAASGEGEHLTTVEKLRPTHKDKHSRSSSPMRSMILNGQMLD
ncbi:hypothetical protein BGZ83_005613 [Gryganskiella cystojenkinii]|nr:hypothetical protein BGZ83_005613 [Gryganskiella cystojenkinii]